LSELNIVNPNLFDQNIVHMVLRDGLVPGPSCSKYDLLKLTI